MAREAAISPWLAVFGAPGIIRWGKDMGFDGEVFHEFRTARNIALQTEIPGHHQSLGTAESRCGHFRMIIGHIIGNRKAD